MCKANCTHGRKLVGARELRDGAELVSLYYFDNGDGSATIEWRRKDGRTGVHAHYGPGEWELVENAEHGPTAGRILRKRASGLAPKAALAEESA